MADTPETSPKRTKKASAEKPVKGGSDTVSDATAAAAPVKTAATRSAPAQANGNGNGAASQGWSAQIAPLKAQAEKAAKVASETARAASEKLGSVDWKTHIDPLKEQAGKTAKSAAGVAKDRTGSAMASLAKLISDTAGTVDAKLGPQYGDYARQAAESVAGAAQTLDGKDVDQLLDEAKDFVRRSPAVAIGAAAVVGFVLMRLAKGSDSDEG